MNARDRICPPKFQDSKLGPEAYEPDASGFYVCARLTEVSEPFDANQVVEIKLELAPCHGLVGGELLLRVPVETARLYYRGDEFSLRLRLI